MEVVLTTLAATLCMQVGFFLWKLSAAQQPRIGVAPAAQVLRALLCSPAWVAGTLATMAGWVLFIRATHLGEISIVQPLMSTGDLVLVLLAVVFLGERLGARECLGLAVTVLGAFGLALGAQTVPGAAWAGADLAALLAAIAVAAALLLRRARQADKADQVVKVKNASQGELPLAAAVGLAFGTGALLTEAWTASAAPNARALLNPLLWGLVAANVAGLVLLQAAFQRGRASVVVPVQLAVANALAVGGGAWLFGEALTPARLLSVALILAGAALLQGRAPAPGPVPAPALPPAAGAPAKPEPAPP